MNSPILRRGWMLLLLSASCGGGDPGSQTPGTAPPAAVGQEAEGGSSVVSSDMGGSSSSSSAGAIGTGASSSGAPGGSSGAPSNASGGTGSGNVPAASADSGGGSGGLATARDLAGSADGGVATASPPSSSGGNVVPSPASLATLDVFAGAPAYISKIGNSAHNPGQSCAKSGCHGPGGGETPFIVGGTVYKDYKGTIPAPGVEIRVMDMAGHAASVYSGANGNFYINSGGSGVSLPAVVSARDGTTTRPMVTKLTTAGMTSCASGGCHVVGGTDGGPVSGAYYPIHVP